jgi:ribosome maturation factor RimP
MKRVTIQLSRLHYLELGQFINRALIDFSTSGVYLDQDPDLKAMVTDLSIQSSVFDASLMQIKAKAESELLFNLDTNRDEKVVTIRRAHAVYQYSKDIQIKAAFDLLKLVFKTYKNIEGASFEAESLGLDNFIKEMRSIKHFNAIQLLHLEVFLNELEQANNEFKATFNLRAMNTITATVYDTKTLRADITIAYNNLADYILVMAKTKKTPYYDNALTALNYGRKYFSDLMAKRSGGTKEVVSAQ